MTGRGDEYPLIFSFRGFWVKCRAMIHESGNMISLAGYPFRGLQRDRRNITDADIVKRVLLLDERKDVGANQYSNEAGSSEPSSKQPERSAETTAKKAGTSATKVKKVRAGTSCPDKPDN